MNCPTVPPECGGIIGSNDGSHITHVVLDRGYLTNNGGAYKPNTHFLNQIIKEWAEHGIEFRGVFHTHAPQWPDLSNNDKIYIYDILNAMPFNIQFLYFPLIIPKAYVKNYIAFKSGNAISIVGDSIEII